MWLLWRENSVRLESIGEWILVIFYDSLEDFWTCSKMLKELDFEKLDDEMIELNNKIIKGMWVIIERIGLKYNFFMIIWKSYTITFRSNNVWRFIEKYEYCKNKVLFLRKYKVFNRIAFISKNFYFYDKLMKINEEISYIIFLECGRIKIYCIDHKNNILFVTNGRETNCKIRFVGFYSLACLKKWHA